VEDDHSSSVGKVHHHQPWIEAETVVVDRDGVVVVVGRD
jgi:hypothetical protein